MSTVSPGFCRHEYVAVSFMKLHNKTQKKQYLDIQFLNQKRVLVNDKMCDTWMWCIIEHGDEYEDMFARGLY